MNDTANRTISASRLVDAPREKVWRALTDPERIGQWWGPNGFTTKTSVMDLRPGGIWEHVMVGPDGKQYPNHVTYNDVIPPEKLVYTHDGSNEFGFLPFQTTITLETVGGKTRVTLSTIFASPEEREKQIKTVGAEEGGKQTLARLAEYLTKN